jgi:surfeit locus 1 family protein
MGCIAERAAMAVFVSLGAWQLDRGRDKQALVDSFQQGSQSVVALDPGVELDAVPRYQHIEATGRYDAARQILLDNMPSQFGKPGFRVLTPLRRDGTDRLLLVDRGWVPLGATREALPSVDVSSAVRTVSGRLDALPAPGVRVGAAGSPATRAGHAYSTFRSEADLEAVLGAPVEARILLLEPAAPDGYERVWRPAMRFGPERHLGYAVQWFAFALVTLVIFIALSLRPIDAGEVTDGRQP